MPLPVFTRQELARGDGRHGAPALVACCGQVYDLSASYHWRNGSHWVQHQAGQDLTVALSRAPHGLDHLRRFPIVGTLLEV